VALEDIIFSAGGGFLVGVVVGFALKKLIKLAAIVFGLFLAKKMMGRCKMDCNRKCHKKNVDKYDKSGGPRTYFRAGIEGAPIVKRIRGELIFSDGIPFDSAVTKFLEKDP